jgi:hypothetical protein
MIARAADVSHAPAAGTKKMRGADGGDDAEGAGKRVEVGGGVESGGGGAQGSGAGCGTGAAGKQSVVTCHLSY